MILVLCGYAKHFCQFDHFVKFGTERAANTWQSNDYLLQLLRVCQYVSWTITNYPSTTRQVLSFIDSLKKNAFQTILTWYWLIYRLDNALNVLIAETKKENFTQLQFMWFAVQVISFSKYQFCTKKMVDIKAEKFYIESF